MVLTPWLTHCGDGTPSTASSTAPLSWTPVWPRPSSALRRTAHQARQRDCPAAESGSLGPQENENTLRKQTLFRPRTARAPPSPSHSFLVSLFVFTLNVSFRSKDAQGAVCWPLLTVITANWYENYFKVWKLARSDRIEIYLHTYIWFIQYQKEKKNIHTFSSHFLHGVGKVRRFGNKLEVFVMFISRGMTCSTLKNTWFHIAVKAKKLPADVENKIKMS